MRRDERRIRHTLLAARWRDTPTGSLGYAQSGGRCRVGQPSSRQHSTSCRHSGSDSTAWAASSDDLDDRAAQRLAPSRGPGRTAWRPGFRAALISRTASMAGRRDSWVRPRAARTTHSRPDCTISGREGPGVVPATQLRGLYGVVGGGAAGFSPRGRNSVIPRHRRFRTSARTVAMLVGICLQAWPGAVSGFAQDPEDPRGASWMLRVLDKESGVPLGGVLVSSPGLAESRVTDSLGVASVPPGIRDSVRVVATRVGYSAMDTVVTSPASGTTLDLPLARSAIVLASLTVEAERAGANSRELARQMFEREVAIGAVGMTQAEVRAVPAVAEADIFRSLQSLSGVTSISDFGAEMFVRGGDADQVAVLLDGAPVSSALITCSGCSGCSTRTPSSGPARCHERRPSLGPRQMAGGRAKSRC